jgi:hypothetical protein
MEPTRPVSDVSHYLGMFRRHWWIALLATGAGLGTGAVVVTLAAGSDPSSHRLRALNWIRRLAGRGHR